MASSVSARISSHIVDLDELLPRFPTDHDDVSLLRPWVFDGTEDAANVQISEWPKDYNLFNDFFRNYSHYRQMLECLGHIQGRLQDRRYKGVSGSLVETDIITLPRKNSDVPEFRVDSAVYETQQRALFFLIRETFWALHVNPFHDRTDCNLQINGVCPHVRRYYIDGKRFDAQTPGYVAFAREDGRKRVPIISFTAWIENQTWNDFLVETVTIMLGHLAVNASITGRLNVADQEVFVVGFHGYHFHIARAFFPAETILRVHSKGCSEDESLELEFTRGYDLFQRTDWLEATEALARLVRYLMGGSANVSILQRLFADKRRTEAKKDGK